MILVLFLCCYYINFSIIAIVLLTSESICFISSSLPPCLRYSSRFDLDSLRYFNAVAWSSLA